MNPVVSIITPSYNRADIIHETAQSIFNQVYPKWEWVIVDDGSTDNSWDLLQVYAAKDDRVKIFKRNREPKGACSCRNIAVEKATGNYLIFLDTDDLLATFCLQQRIDTILKYPDVDFVIFPMLLFKHKPDDLKLLWNIDSPKDDLERILLGDPVCQGTGTLWKKSSFVAVGMWNEQLMLWQDIELHLRSLLRGMKYVKRFDLKPDVFLRISDVSLSRTGFHSLPKFNSRLKVLQETGETIRQNHKLLQYKNGLRAMFTEIFVNAANSNYWPAVEKMMDMQEGWSLFSKGEQKSLQRYVLARKSKMYKIPFLQHALLNRLQQFIQTQENTLNKIYYQQTIQI